MHKHTLQMGHVRAVCCRSCSLRHARMHGRQKTWLHSGRILQGTHHFLVAEPSIIHALKTWITNPKRRPTKLGISRQSAQWCLAVPASGGTAAVADAVVAGADRVRYVIREKKGVGYFTVSAARKCNTHSEGTTFSCEYRHRAPNLHYPLE